MSLEPKNEGNLLIEDLSLVFAILTERESVQHSPLVNRNETTGIGHFYCHVRWIFADRAKNDIPK